jgi:hypothetical protein
MCRDQQHHDEDMRGNCHVYGVPNFAVATCHSGISRACQWGTSAKRQISYGTYLSECCLSKSYYCLVS